MKQELKQQLKQELKQQLKQELIESAEPNTETRLLMEEVELIKRAMFDYLKQVKELKRELSKTNIETINDAVLALYHIILNRINLILNS